MFGAEREAYLKKMAEEDEARQLAQKLQVLSVEVESLREEKRKALDAVRAKERKKSVARRNKFSVFAQVGGPALGGVDDDGDDGNGGRLKETIQTMSKIRRFENGLDAGGER